MNPDPLASAQDATWLYAAAPLLAVAALWLTVRLRLPQLLRLGEAFRGLREDPDAGGQTSPSVATALAAVGGFGAAAAVGTATAVGIGGAGAVAWLWLLGFVLAPLRFAETVLARTSPPGKANAGATGSLAVRLMHDRAPALRALGALLAFALAVAAFAFVGGVHGEALADAAHRLLPDSVPWLLGGVAVVGAAITLAGSERAASVAGWVGLVGLGVVLVAGAWAAASDPSRAAGTLGRTIGEALQGAPTAQPFVGAFAGEIAFAALTSILPAAGGATGVAGAMQSLGRARSTKAQAAVSMLDPLALAVLGTVLGMAFVATGAFYKPVQDERPLLETRFYRIGFETASQREEADRVHEGYVRIAAGEMRDVNIDVGTAQGMIDDPRFVHDGEPADIALHIDDTGRAFRILAPGERGSLKELAPAELRDIRVEGEMLPGGGALLTSALRHGTDGEMGGRVALAGLLALAAVAVGVWGLALRRSLPRVLPPAAGAAVGLLPALGVALQASLELPWLGPVGGIAAGVLASLAAIALLARSREASELV